MKNLVGGILLIFSILLFFYYLSRYTFGVPELDDYFAVLGFINYFSENNHLTDQLKLLYGQIAEHRIVFQRLLNLTTLFLTGKIQMAWLVYLGNLTVIALLIVFFYSFQVKKAKIWYFAPVAFLLLQQQYNEITLSATASAQHTSVLFFTFLSFYYLSKTSPNALVRAMIAAFVATFTSANGIFAFFIGLICLLLQMRWKDCIAWVGFSTFVIFIYFFDYEHYGHLKISNLWTYPLQMLLYGLHFIGASFHISKWGYGIALVFGCAILVWFIFLLLKKYYIKNITLTGIWLFLLLTTVLISLGRFEIGFAYRYNLYSAIFLIVSYLSFLEWSSERWRQRLAPLILLLSIGFSLFSYYDYTAFAETVRREKVANIFNLQSQNEALINYFYGGFLVKASTENTQMPLKAIQKGTYQFPKHSIDSLKHKLTDTIPFTKNDINLDIVLGDTLQISNTEMQIGNRTDDATYVIAKSSTKTYLLMTFSQKNSFLTYLKTGFYYRAGFTTSIVNSIFEGEKYRLGIVWISDKKLNIVWTNKTIN
jgi:hypothetical protein